MMTIVYHRRALAADTDTYGGARGFSGGQLGAGCSVLAGRKYSQAEIKGLLAQAGWPSNLIDQMSAIIMGESGGYQGAHNSCGENSCGLCQVYVDVHPEYSCQQMLNDPIANLRACYKIYTDRGGGDKGFRAWGAYGNGSYRQFLGGSNVAAVTPIGSPPVGGFSVTPEMAVLGVLLAVVLLG